MEWLASQGYVVYCPIGHRPECDLIVDDGQTLQRVQVNTTTYRHEDRWVVTLCARGGNQSWNGTVKRFSPSRCDVLFVLVADGRRWFIPSGAVAAGTRVLLGGPKYAEFEVDAGRPLFSEQS